jgi:hypothetical protein
VVLPSARRQGKDGDMLFNHVPLPLHAVCVVVVTYVESVYLRLDDERTVQLMCVSFVSITATLEAWYLEWQNKSMVYATTCKVKVFLSFYQFLKTTCLFISC